MRSAWPCFASVGHAWGIALALRHRGYIAYLQGDLARALGCYQEALALDQQLGDTANRVWTLGCLAEMAAAQGDHARAAALFVESLKLARQVADSAGVAWCVTGLMRLAAVQGAAEQQARFLGAVEALLDQLDVRFSRDEQADWERQRCIHLRATDRRIVHAGVGHGPVDDSGAGW